MSFRCAEKSQDRHSIMMKIEWRPYGADKTFPHRKNDKLQ